MGFSLERYQMPRMIAPCNTITAGNPTGSAAGTVLAEYVIPTDFGTVQLFKHGMKMAAAGGAQTTNAVSALYKNGTLVANSELTSVADHAADAVVEASLNATSNGVTAAPNYPTVVAGDLLETRVKTQGVGAGDTTAFFYILVKPTWP